MKKMGWKEFGKWLDEPCIHIRIEERDDEPKQIRNILNVTPIDNDRMAQLELENKRLRRLLGTNTIDTSCRLLK